MNKFIILGLPRSRTYWLSKFLGCIHEGIYYYPDYGDFIKSTEIGDSTTAYPLVKKFIGECKKVIIHRDLNEVKQSLGRLFGERDWDNLNQWTADLRREEGLHINFNDINDNLEMIWRYCKNEPLPKGREEMKYQVLNNEFLIKEVRSCL